MPRVVQVVGQPAVETAERASDETGPIPTSA
jgi:hypothetical protein